jgi:catechol 2,3-dioxygenase-like lactoylglutathione lyase family enzyme
MTDSQITETNPSVTQGVHHLGLTVPDLDRARGFFSEVLRFETVGEVPDYPAVFLSDGSVMLTLWQAEDPATAVPFDRRRVIGLHHFALRVADAAALEDLYKRLLEEPDVEIEFAPEALGGGPTRHMICAVPGGIRLELIAAAAA